MADKYWIINNKIPSALHPKAFESKLAEYLCEAACCPICRCLVAKLVIIPCECQLKCLICIDCADKWTSHKCCNNTNFTTCYWDKKNIIKVSNYDNIIGKCHDCDWEGILSKYENHYKNDCPNANGHCPNNDCKNNYKRNEANKHYSECNYILEQCDLCKANIIRKDKQCHSVICPAQVWKCDMCGIVDIFGNKQKHLDICPKREVECKYAKYGCNSEIIYDQAAEHYKSMLDKHIELFESFEVKSYKEITIKKDTQKYVTDTNIKFSNVKNNVNMASFRIDEHTITVKINYSDKEIHVRVDSPTNVFIDGYIDIIYEDYDCEEQIYTYPFDNDYIFKNDVVTHSIENLVKNDAIYLNYSLVITPDGSDKDSEDEYNDY